MHCNFYKVNSEPNYTLYYRSEGGRDRKLVDTSIYSTLIDTKAPVLEKTYVASPITTGDKLRIALRFNEPVYVVGSQNLTLKIRINTDWNAVTDLVFAGGNYTDTLYFEIEYEKLNLPNEKITSITTIYGSGIINDLGYRTARNAGQTPYYVNNTLNLSIIPSHTVEVMDVDLRTPQLEISSETANSIQKQHSVTVNVSNIDLEDSKLYFSWEETSSSIKNVIKNKNYYGSASETNTIIGGDGHTKLITINKIIVDKNLINQSLFFNIFKILLQQEENEYNNRIMLTTRFNECFKNRVVDIANTISNRICEMYSFTSDLNPSFIIP
jgi:hypothetical protein